MNIQAENGIAIVIVLYKTSLELSMTYKTLKLFISNINTNFEIIIYNNSDTETISENSNYQVVTSQKNDKLSGPYNYTLKFAKEHNLKWILLLDQDTEITKEYFVKLADFLCMEKDSDLVAVVPFLKENSKVLSPQKINNFGWWQRKIVTPGYQTGRVTAFNSLSLLDVEFMLSIGGFNIEYPLDMLDHWYYLQIYNQRKKVYVLDTYIEHQLSLSNYENNVSFERHRSLLKAEKGFTKELGITHYLSYKIRLTLRLIRQFIFFKDKRYALIIFKTLIGKL